MLKTVSKLKKGLRGEITIPSDKSISHRAAILSVLAEGGCVIKNFSSGVDCRSTLEVLKNLGADIEYLDKTTLKTGVNRGKNAAGLNPPVFPLNAGNSGTTMRLLTGILAGQNFNSVFTGDESLSKRPMKRIIEPLVLMGADISSVDGHAPLTIKGRKLRGISYESKLASAQVKSCILLAGLNAEGKTVFKEPFQSRDHTERMLKYLGADILSEENVTEIQPSKLHAKDIEIAGDISSAAFFITAGLITEGSDLIIKNTGLNPTRTGMLNIVKRMGGEAEIFNRRIISGEEAGDIRVCYTDKLKACTISGEDIPRLIDELPVIAVLASQAEGETIVKNAQDLRNKESDRISCLVKGLQKIGVKIEETPDGFKVCGSGAGKGLKGGVELESMRDHRLAMSFYVAGLVCKNEISINGFEWTEISFPEFEELFNQAAELL